MSSKEKEFLEFISKLSTEIQVYLASLGSVLVNALNDAKEKGSAGFEYGQGHLVKISHCTGEGPAYFRADSPDFPDFEDALIWKDDGDVYGLSLQAAIELSVLFFTRASFDVCSK